MLNNKKFSIQKISPISTKYISNRGKAFKVINNPGETQKMRTRTGKWYMMAALVKQRMNGNERTKITYFDALVA